VLVGLNTIATDLGMSQGEIAWIPASMGLTAGSFLLLGGRLSDLYGRKRMCTYCMLGFSVWMLISSFATEKYVALLFEF
jgi:MFS family permease